MELSDLILKQKAGGPVSELAGQFGLGEDQVASAIQSMLPALAGGLQRNISQGGMENLLGALTKGQHQRYLDDPSILKTDTARDDGNQILGHILGSKDVSRQVAAQASARTGISQSILKQMLPVVAALAMGALNKKMATSSTPGSLSENAAASSSGAGLMGMLTPFLDRDRDGSVADDILGSVSGFFKK